MALNTLKCNYLTSLHFKGLISCLYLTEQRLESDKEDDLLPGLSRLLGKIYFVAYYCELCHDVAPLPPIDTI